MQILSTKPEPNRDKNIQNLFLVIKAILGLEEALFGALYLLQHSLKAYRRG